MVEVPSVATASDRWGNSGASNTGVIKIDTQAPHVACAHKPPPGLYTTGWNESYPRLQPLTIAELLKDRGVAYPAWSANSTYKSAPRT